MEDYVTKADPKYFEDLIKKSEECHRDKIKEREVRLVVEKQARREAHVNKRDAQQQEARPGRNEPKDCLDPTTVKFYIDQSKAVRCVSEQDGDSNNKSLIYPGSIHSNLSVTMHR